MTLYSETYISLAFYGIDRSSESARAFYEFILKWHRDLGEAPDKMSIEGPGHSGKLISFVRADSKLRRTGFAGVADFNLLRFLPGGTIPVRDYLTDVGWSTDSKMSWAIFSSSDSLISLNVDSIYSLAVRIIQILNPAYGIGYEMERRRGPSLFAVGINASFFNAPLIVSGPEYEAELNVSRWGDLGMKREVYHEGLLRDVFPWNFLTRPQLDRPVGGTTLERWIQQDQRRGRLLMLTDEMVGWQVEAAEIASIREQLQQAQAIFDWRMYL